MLRSVRSVVTDIFRRSRFEREMTEELRFHLDARVAHLVASGMPVDEARRRARLEFGGIDSYKDRCREARGLRLIDEWRADLRYLARVVRRSPSLALVAITSIALGVGANALVFSVVNALVLRPLPVAQPDRLLFVEAAGGPSYSFPDYRDLRDRNQAFEGLVGCRISPMNLETASGSARVWGYLATGNYFDVLGVRPHLGRFFHAQDDRRPGDSPLAVISYDAWQTRFSADPAIVGTTIRINRRPYTVLGVAPRGFRGTELFYKAEIWVPMMMQAEIEVGNPWLETRASYNTWILGRLKAGVSPAQAAANLNAIGGQLGREYPTYGHGVPMRLSRPGLVGDVLRGPVRAFTTGVLVLAGLVLLAACANLAGLFLSRGAERQRELAIRLSIGAGPPRLMRQLLTETLVLSIVGGFAGWALAAIASTILTAWHAPLDFPVQFDVRADWRVFLFALIVSTAAGLLCGVAPARRAARLDPNVALRSTGDAKIVGRWAARDLLVVLQVASSFALVSACLLSLRGLQQSVKMPLGFDANHAAVIGFDLGLSGYNSQQGAEFQARALAAVQRIPGVEAAAYSNSVPLSIDQSGEGVTAEGDPLEPSRAHSTFRYQVSAGFFRAMRTRLLRGRDFDARDDARAPLVAVVNETFASRIVRSPDALGKRFRSGPGGVPVRIVGIVEDGKYQSLTEDAQPAMFVPMLQRYNSTTTLIARSAMPPGQLVADMRRAVTSLDARLPIYGAGTLHDMLGLALLPSRAAAIALGAFGLLAILTTATGIHAVAVHAVGRRRREIGIRRAVGADTGQILRLVLARVVGLLVVGGAAGLLLALAIDRLLASIVYQASQRDPIVLAGGIVTMLLVGTASAWRPARQALRVDPITVLRSE